MLLGVLSASSSRSTTMIVSSLAVVSIFSHIISAVALPQSLQPATVNPFSDPVSGQTQVNPASGGGATNTSTNYDGPSFYENVSRGIVRARSVYTHARLVDVIVEPYPFSEPADPASLTHNLKLILWEPGPGRYIQEDANGDGAYTWGEWKDPVVNPSFRFRSFQIFEWDNMLLEVGDAVRRLKMAGYRDAWTKVTVHQDENDAEPCFCFWQKRNRQDPGYPVYVRVGAHTGQVKAWYSSTPGVGLEIEDDGIGASNLSVAR